MVTNQFGAIIQELGRTLGYDISPNVEDNCTLPLPNGINIQMEMDDQKEFFILGAEIGNAPAGRYREELFREAMLYNGIEKRAGTFAYSEVSDNLVLFKELPLRELNGEKVAAALVPLGEKASAWKKAMTRGEMPPVDAASSSSSGGGGILNPFTGIKL